MYKINDIINTIIQGHVLDILKQLPDESIHMCITSPPYWGLRNYSTNPQIWDGNENCNHEWGNNIKIKQSGGKGHKQDTNRGSWFESSTYFCVNCGAWKGELGNEPTYQLYINHLIQIFNEMNRILTKDGTCWVNLGDSYAGSNQGAGTKNPTPKQASNRGTNYMSSPNHKSILSKTNIKAKSLIGIPDRFKIAMIDNGWICRNEIIWHKPNQMPSSVKDRFTVDYEKLYFFTKNKKYYFEQQLEPLADVTIKRDKYTRQTKKGKTAQETPYAVSHLHDSKSNPKGRNKRSVWSINTKPLKDAHFAVFPPDLVEIPIKAGCVEEGIVIDPFMGSGSTAIKAMELNRNYVGIELNPEYIEIANSRIKEII